MNSTSRENQTAKSFKQKWDNNQQLAFEATSREGSTLQTWILERNGWSSSADLRSFLQSNRRILDAGCGNGRVTALLQKYAPVSSEIVGIDLVASEVAKTNLKDLENVKVFRGDLLESLVEFGRFDFVYCQEVLHHTAAPEKAFKNLVENSLNDFGTIAIYVYKRKAPAREFVDDFLREKLKERSYEDAMTTCRQITELGRSLHESEHLVTVPDVPALGIEKGTYPVQRFLYHFFVKCFWNPELSFEENAAVNFDWYSPQLCDRYEPEEIRQWFKNSGLEITHEFVDFYGITMHGKKRIK